MTNKSTQIIIAGMALLAGVLAIGIYLGLEQVDHYLKIKAIDDCGKISRYEKRIDEFTTVWYPDNGIYKSCLDDKGVTQ